MRYILIVVSMFLMIGCSNSNDPAPDVDPDVEQEEKVKENIISFGEIEVIVANKAVHMKGEAKAKYDHFYFTLEQDEVILIEETKVELGEEEVPEWRTFEIEVTLDKEALKKEEAPFIKLYGIEDDEELNKHFVPIEIVDY